MIRLSSPQNSNNPVYRRIYEHMERTKSFVSSMEEGVQRAKEGNYAFIGESVSLDLAVARHCDLVRAHEVVGMRGYSIAAAHGEARGWVGGGGGRCPAPTDFETLLRNAHAGEDPRRLPPRWQQLKPWKRKTRSAAREAKPAFAMNHG